MRLETSSPTSPPPVSRARIHVVYSASGDVGAASELAGRIAYEQTVELPVALVPEGIRENVVGRVESVVSHSFDSPGPKDPDASLITISYDAALSSGHLGQFLNLVFGNVSMYPGVRLVDLKLPGEVTESLRGPRFGVAGVRTLTGVHGRPLLATALKPQGAEIDELASLAHRFALGGGDIVKDDQNLTDDFERFKHRVEACRRAVDEANHKTGRRCLYFPHLSAPSGELERYLDFVALSGLKGVLVCPMILGLETTRGIGEKYPLVLMAHPAMTGTFTNAADQGIDHGLLLGTMFRLAGSDLSIFPNVGGRFSFSLEQCNAIVHRLRAPLNGLARSWPAPGGGMQLSAIPEMCQKYGEDTVLLVGGALHGESSDVAQGTGRFLAAIQAQFSEKLCAPAEVGSGDSAPVEIPASYLPFQPGYEWEGRESTPYKDAGDLTFKGVRRVELVGKFGESTSSDLRYFEVEPGGHTSREKHLHTHIVIGARGEAVFSVGNRREPFREHDVAYIKPLEVHQFVNEGDEPFGFYCVVDHKRDRPMKP